MIFTTDRPEPTGNLCPTNCPKCFPTQEILRGRARWTPPISLPDSNLNPASSSWHRFDFIHLSHLASQAESDFIHLNHDLLPSNIPVSAWVCMSSACARQHLWTRDTSFGTDLTSYSHCSKPTNNETEAQMKLKILRQRSRQCRKATKHCKSSVSAQIKISLAFLSFDLLSRYHSDQMSARPDSSLKSHPLCSNSKGTIRPQGKVMLRSCQSS